MTRKMLLGDPPPIHLTSQDFGRLDVLLANLSTIANTPTLKFLQDELDRARLVADADTATPFVQIGSRVLFRDDDGKTYRLTLALPESGDDPGHISILTPVGAALLGLSEGQSIAYETRDNRVKTITVLEIAKDPTQTR